MSQPSPKYEWFYNIWKLCLSYLSMKKRVVYFIVIFIVISLSLWSVGPFLLVSMQFNMDIKNYFKLPE